MVAGISSVKAGPEQRVEMYCHTVLIQFIYKIHHLVLLLVVDCQDESILSNLVTEVGIR